MGTAPRGGLGKMNVSGNNDKNKQNVKGNTNVTHTHIGGESNMCIQMVVPRATCAFRPTHEKQKKQTMQRSHMSTTQNH